MLIMTFFIDQIIFHVIFSLQWIFQNYCQSLERALAELRQQHRDLSAELNAVKIELAQTKYCKDENQDLTNHLQKQQIDVEEVTKVVNSFLSL